MGEALSVSLFLLVYRLKPSKIICDFDRAGAPAAINLVVGMTIR